MIDPSEMPQIIKQVESMLKEHCGENYLIVVRVNGETWTITPNHCFARGACEMVIGDIETQWDKGRYPQEFDDEP